MNSAATLTDREVLLAAMIGNASSTPAPAPAPSPRKGDWREHAASDKQTAFIRILLAERAGNPEAEGVRAGLNSVRETHGFISKGVSSRAIEDLKAIPDNPKAPTQPKVAEQIALIRSLLAERAGNPKAPTQPKVAENFKRPVEVPEGHYAVDNADGELRFYTVKNVEEGRWAGYTFVEVHRSDDRLPVKGNERTRVLRAIAVDPGAASVRYGIETNHCGVCGRELTDADSRAAGIGPVCSKNKGW